MAATAKTCFGENFPVFVCFRNEVDKKHEELEIRMTNGNTAEDDNGTFQFREGVYFNPVENSETLVKFLIANGVKADAIGIFATKPRYFGQYELPQRHVLVNGTKQEIDNAIRICERFSSNFAKYETKEQLLANAVIAAKKAKAPRVFPAATKVSTQISFAELAGASQPANQHDGTGFVALPTKAPITIESTGTILARKQLELEKLQAEIEVLKAKLTEEARQEEQINKTMKMLQENAELLKMLNDNPEVLQRAFTMMHEQKSDASITTSTDAAAVAVPAQ